MANVTGWNELMNGSLISAAFTMYNAAMAGWTVAILFFVYQFMLFFKTRNLTLCWTTSLIFAVMYATSTIVKSISVQIMFVLLVIELGAILYLLIFK